MNPWVDTFAGAVIGQRPMKTKVIRSTISFTADDHAGFDTLLDRCIQMGLVANKSALVRAGIDALMALEDGALKTVVKAKKKLKRAG